MTQRSMFFDLVPLVNWPNDEEFRVIRDLEKQGLIQETCPSERAWHFVIHDEKAFEQLPHICFAKEMV